MKEIKYFLSVIILSGIVLYSGCGGGEDGTPLTDQQKAAQSLAEGSPWSVSNVSSKPSADVDVTELENLSLSFGITGTESEIAPGIFSASGAPNFITTTSASWSWAGSGIGTISISGSSVSQFTNVSLSPNIDNPTSLTLSFTVQNAGGRTQGIVGDYTIQLDPNN